MVDLALHLGLIMLDRMQFEHLVVTLFDLLIILRICCFLVKLQVSKTYNPPPEHVLVWFVQLWTQLIKHRTATFAIESTPIVIHELHFLLLLQFLGVYKLFSWHFLCFFIFLASVGFCNILVFPLVFWIVFELLEFIFGFLLVRIFTVVFITYILIWILVIEYFLVNSIIFLSRAFVKTFAPIMNNEYFLFIVIDVIMVVRSMWVNKVAFDVLFFAKPLISHVQVPTTVDKEHASHINTAC